MVTICYHPLLFLETGTSTHASAASTEATSVSSFASTEATFTTRGTVAKLSFAPATTLGLFATEGVEAVDDVKHAVGVDTVIPCVAAL